MQKITPFLWFDNQAEEAAKFYTSVFRDSKINAITRYSGAWAEASWRPEWTVMTANFSLNGQEFVALNGWPVFHFTQAISFVVNCETQEEVDWFWERLSEGWKEDQCWWLQDRFGVSWQIVPTVLEEMLAKSNPEQAEKVMQSIFKMKRLDIAELKKAYEE